MAPFPNVISERLRLWRHGRDAYVHRILTLLFLGRSPDPWNLPSRLSDNGARFLKSIDQVLFDEEWDAPEEFYWEYKLPKRPDDKENGWPDFAALWAERVLLFELRTDPGTHRDAQVDWYLQLGAHNFLNRAIDLVYLTPEPIRERAQSLPDLARVRNCTWADMAKIIEAAWIKTPGSESANAQVFAQYLREMGRVKDAPTPYLPSANKTRKKKEGGEGSVSPFTERSWNRILDTLVDVLEDGYDRALEVPLIACEDAKDLRRKIRSELEVGDYFGDAVGRFEFWIWQQNGDDEPLSDSGKQCGVEIRVSRAR